MASFLSEDSASQRAAGIKYFERQEYVKAESHFRASLREGKSDNHQDTLLTKYWLALTLFELKAFKKAQSLLEKVLDGQQEKLGEDHHDTLNTMRKLGWTLYQRKHYKKAEARFREIVEIRERKLGSQPHKLLQGDYWLAWTPKRREKLKVEQEGKVTEDYAEYFQDKRGLGMSLFQRQKYDEAIKVLLQTIEGQEERISQPDIDTLSSKHSLALILYKQGLYEEAEKIFQRTVDERETKLGKTHPDTLESKRFLAFTSYHVSNYKATEDILKQVLKQQEKILDKKEANVCSLDPNGGNLAKIRLHKPGFDQGLESYHFTINAQNLLREAHIRTLTSKYWLGKTMFQQNRFKEAEKMFRLAFDGQKKNLGILDDWKLCHREDDNSETMEKRKKGENDFFWTMSWLARSLVKMRQYGDAAELLELLHDKQVPELGDLHEDTQMARELLMSLKNLQDKVNEAKRASLEAADQTPNDDQQLVSNEVVSLEETKSSTRTQLNQVSSSKLCAKVQDLEVGGTTGDENIGSDHEDDVSDGEPGTFDSVIRPASHITDSPAEKTFSELQRIIRHHFCYKEKDKRVKIAILDTGIDGDHPDFQRPRAKRLTFVDDVIEHADAKGEIPQCQRITAFKDFCSDSEGEKLVDVDGHGTYIAGIILRLAPWADLVVARVCFGDVNRGVPSTQRRQTSRKNRDETRPDPTVVARAIEWATEQGADLINASFGYNEYQPVIEAALMKAEKHGILTFAATSNEGNHQDVAYPARSNFTIGVHSCNDMGTRSSEFTPSAQPRDHNFMAIGENIISQWSSSKGGSYRIGSGTSFATPVVTAMAALILAFANQTMSSQSRAQFLSEEDIRRLKERNGMAAVLAALSKGVHENKYLWIRPTLLWCNFDRTGPDSSDEHAWRVLKDALRHR